MEYHRNNSKKNTIRNYTFILARFDEKLGDKDFEEITSDDILSFLAENTTHTKQNTKRSRYAEVAVQFYY